MGLGVATMNVSKKRSKGGESLRDVRKDSSNAEIKSESGWTRGSASSFCFSNLFCLNIERRRMNWCLHFSRSSSGGCFVAAARESKDLLLIFARSEERSSSAHIDKDSGGCSEKGECNIILKFTRDDTA